MKVSDFLSNVMRRLHFSCLMFGHDDGMRCARGRLYLECAECGREAAGWVFRPVRVKRCDIDQFKPADRVILTWATARDGLADDIIYAGHYDKSPGRNYDYVLPVEIVTFDKTDRTSTFKMPAPLRAVRISKSLRTADRVKVTAPFDQPNETAAILSIERSDDREHPPAATVSRD
jgi:hypothetical protein